MILSLLRTQTLTWLSWQPLTDRQLMNKHCSAEHSHSQPSTPELRLDSAPLPNTSFQTRPSALNGHTCHHGNTEPSPRIQALSSCARTLWVAARLSPGALKQLMRARRTKEGVGKTREWTVCAKGKQMEFFFYIFCLSSAPYCEWLCYNNEYLCIVRVLYLEKFKKKMKEES